MDELDRIRGCRPEHFITRLSHLHADLARELLIDQTGRGDDFTAQAREAIDVIEDTLVSSANAQRFDLSGFAPDAHDLQARVAARCTDVRTGHTSVS